MESFPELGVFFHDDLERDTLHLARQIYRFLEVDDSFEPEFQKRVNKGSYDEMPEEERARLAEVYRADIERFGKMTGRDCSAWLEKR